MARWRGPGEPVPEPLARFVASEWPGADPLGQWRAACMAWLDAVPGRRLPFGEYGGPLDVLRESVRLRRAAIPPEDQSRM